MYEIQSETSQSYAENSPKSNARELENNAVQQILLELHPNCELIKDEFGKPHLQPAECQINYSHSQKFLFWGTHSVYRIGVDVETIRPQLLKIKHKFCRPDEFEFIPNLEEISYLLAIWSAKEAIYKAYGKKEVDFREHMQILPFVLEKQGTFEAYFLIEKTQPITVHYRFENDTMYCWALFTA